MEYYGFDQATVEAVETLLTSNGFWSGDELATHLFAKTIVESLVGYEEPDEFSGVWPYLRPSEEEQVQQAKSYRVRSRDHEFVGSEQSEYDALKAAGRTLYDNLRTQYDWDHMMALNVAVREYGKKE